MRRSSAFLVKFIILVLGLTFAACRHNPPPLPAVPEAPRAAAPAPPSPPVCQLTAEPAAVEQGKSVTLSWSSQNATGVSIEPGLGKQLSEGSTTASPQDSTTYVLTATGPSGTTTCTARVTVTASAAAPAPTVTEENLSASAGPWNVQIKDIFFDYDSADLRPDAQEVLTGDATLFKAHPDALLAIEGHCDERGSEEYNLGLGQRRAKAARDFLVSLGVPGASISTISYGKDKPTCTANSEECWQQNRRDHLVTK
ncbi:MAG TPA: peptidoglycan-associated lipoprotein Pal [Terriglobia bacterium]